MRRRWTLTSWLLLVATCGCSGFMDRLNSLKSWQPPVVADAENPAAEVACIWQPGEGRGPQGVPARGFSGQIFFFTQKNAEPVLVNGTVKVYLFADRGTHEERGKPLHEYDFGPEVWSTHATVTSLGPGYSVFVPYPEPEAYQVRCQLRVRFTPVDGPVVWSEALTMILEGPPRPGSEPHYWHSADAQALIGKGNRIEVSKRSGTPTQLQAGESSEPVQPPRKLRSDTFTMPEVQQVSYETSRRRSREASEQRKARERSDHPLSGRTLETEPEPEESLESIRTLTGAREPKPHPLEAVLGGDKPRRSLPSHPLTRLNSAAAEKPSRFLLSHPLNSSKVATQETRSLRPTAEDASASIRFDEQVELQTAAARLRSQQMQSDRARTYLDASPVYGEWQPVEQ